MDYQPRTELEKLLISLLTEADVRRIVRLLPGGENMHAELPGTSVSLKELVHQAVSVLERHGRLDRAFFEVLVAERPARRDEIRALAARMPGPAPAVPKLPDIIDFKGERGRHKCFFGRQDILREFDDWLRDRESGWLLVTGSPGLGKSAIFHHWLGLREEAGLPVAFHFIRRGIHNWADPSVVRTSLAAQIERDFPEHRDADADAQQRLERLLHRISPVLQQRQQQLVLLVDGLDEAMTLGGADNPIPRIFPHELPKHVFVFAASRPLYPHLGWFTRRTGALHSVDLDGRPGNLEAVRAFWTVLRETLSPPPADDLVRAAIERSQGNLLHAVKLHQLWSQLGARRSIDAIPQGFEGMLSDLWERLGKLPKEQKKVARQGLSLLCAARQALPLSVVDELLDWDEGETRDELLPLLREFLHEEHWHEQPAYRPFHEAVRELVVRELPGAVREHHGRLARFAAWPPTESEFRRGYALRHRVVHQVEAGEIEAAAASCRDVDYLTEKACALGVIEVEREIRLAARVQEPTTREHLSTLALTVGACSHWARQAPEAFPTLLHDRLLSYAPVIHRELSWPTHLRQIGPLLRHPLQNGSLAGVLAGHEGFVNAVAVLPDGRVVSGSPDYTLRVWDVTSDQALATLEGHRGPVVVVATLPDGRVISGSDDHTLRVWDVASGEVLATLEGHHGSVNAVAVLPNGRIVSGSADKTLRVWDVASGQAIATLEGHGGPVLAVAALPNGRVISGSDDHTLRVWGIQSREVFATLEGHHGPVNAVAVLPDGCVVSGSDDYTLRVWDIQSREVLATLEGHHGPVNAVAVLPDGRVVSGSDDHTLRVWGVQSGEMLATLEGHHGPVNAVAVLPDGRVVSGSDDYTSRVWDVDRRVWKLFTERKPEPDPNLERQWSSLGASVPTRATLKGHHGPVNAVAILPARRIISGSKDKTLRLWNVKRGESMATFEGHQRRVWAVAALHDGRVVSGSRDRTLCVWDVEGKQPLTTLTGHQGEILAVAALPDGRFVSGSEDHTLRVWRVPKAQCTSSQDHQGPVMAVAVLPDGRVVTGSEDHTLRVWDIQSGQTFATLTGHTGPVMAVAVLPDGRVVSSSEDHTLRVWNIQSGQTLATLTGHQGPVWAVAVLPDGRIVSGSHDRTLRVWSVESGQALVTLRGHLGPVMAVAVLPDGRVISGSRDRTLRIWSVESGQALATLEGHRDWITTVAVLPDGRVVSGSDDKTLRVWDIASGKAFTLADHHRPVTAVAVFSDGRAVSGSQDQTLRVWDITTGKALATLEGHRGTVSAVAVFSDGRIVSGSQDETLRLWVVENSQALTTLQGHEGPVTAVTVLADGRIVSGSLDKTLRVWDIESRQALATLEGHRGGVMAIAALPDGCVVSGSDDHTLRVWDIASGQALTTLEGHQGGIMAIAALPDGRVVSGSWDKTLRIWNVASGRTIAFVYGETSFRSVAVVDQHIIVAGDAVGNVWFIDLP